ncbi:hypothetical protein N4G70_27575 [Streptomyces sp. ASQP_92]|uniref:hypothetical protein n=1 Tax=Streptomyces sp. ASQP_92 TaxID=2979116 RepID=UPI0021BF6AA0|nr:hypothetical protein [Streptomyces sp. ASQP_92]MCT9092600.1 hypothetical protein [Streptomyces sp. ASQP_92]
MFRAHRALLVSLIGAAAGSAVIAAFTVAQAAPQGPTPAATATASSTEMPSAVEDFTYPGAARILQDQKIILKRGDGHIMLADCKASQDIVVETRTGQEQYCFSVSGKQGYLTLELPNSFGIWPNEHPVQAKITTDGKETVINAPQGPLKTFGEAGDTKKKSVLVELRVTG